MIYKDVIMYSDLKFSKPDLIYESRLTKIESLYPPLLSDISEVKRDLRWLIGIVIAFNSTILGVLAKGLHWM
jgi:hypothetical protein